MPMRYGRLWSRSFARERSTRCLARWRRTRPWRTGSARRMRSLLQRMMALWWERTIYAGIIKVEARMLPTAAMRRRWLRRDVAWLARCASTRWTYARGRGFQAMQFNFVVSTNERAVRLLAELRVSHGGNTARSLSASAGWLCGCVRDVSRAVTRIHSHPSRCEGWGTRALVTARAKC